jgi:hypothetical protein
MSKQSYKMSISFLPSLISIAGIGMIIFSILVAGCTDKNAETSKTISPEIITKRIAPVGKVNIADLPEEANEIATTPANSREEAPQKPASHSGASAQITDTEKTPSKKPN